MKKWIFFLVFLMSLGLCGACGNPNNGTTGQGALPKKATGNLRIFFSFASPNSICPKTVSHMKLRTAAKIPIAAVPGQTSLWKFCKTACGTRCVAIPHGLSH